MKATLSIKSKLSTLFQEMNESEHNLSVEVASICVKLLNELNSLKQVSHSDIAKRSLQSFEKYNEIEEVSKYVGEVSSILESFYFASIFESINNNLKLQESPIFSKAIETLNKLEEMSNEEIRENKHLIKEHKWINSIGIVSNELDGIIAEENSLVTKGVKRNLITPVILENNRLHFFANNTVFSISEDMDLSELRVEDATKFPKEFMVSANLIKNFNLTEGYEYSKTFDKFSVRGNFETGEHFISEKSVSLDNLKNTALTKGASIEDLGDLETIILGESTHKEIYVLEGAFQLLEGSKITTYIHKGGNGIAIEYDVNENVSYTNTFEVDALVEEFSNERNIDLSEEFSTYTNDMKKKKFLIKDEVNENKKKLNFLKDKVDEMSMVKKNFGETLALNQAINFLQTSIKELKENNTLLENSIKDEGFIEVQLKKEITKHGLKKGQEVMVDALAYSKSSDSDLVDVIVGKDKFSIKRGELKVLI